MGEQEWVYWVIHHFLLRRKNNVRGMALVAPVMALVLGSMVTLELFTHLFS
jgi:hypothetical protein